MIRLNRAVTVSQCKGPAAGLAEISKIEGELDNYHLLHAAKADLLRRLGRLEEALNAYNKALGMVSVDSERRFLEQRIREIRVG